MTAIECDGLTKTYGTHTAVEELNLTVREGEIYGLLGPNGAGKSTTIDLLLGFITPTSGSATVLGHDIAAASRIARERIGVLPDGYALYGRLSGIEHLQFAGGLKGSRVDFEPLVQRVGLSVEDANRRASTYSTGMKQRLALAMALIEDPDLLILDEPTSGLDPNGVSLLEDIVREEARTGTTVFYSSHVLSHVESICDRVGVLNQGRLVAVHEIDELETSEEPGATDRTLSDLFETYTSGEAADLHRRPQNDEEAA